MPSSNHGIVLEEALAVAGELGLPRWWLNEQLTQVLGLHTVDDVIALVGEIFPEEEPPARLRLLLQDIISDQDG